jgi:hypothetical protein
VRRALIWNVGLSRREWRRLATGVQSADRDRQQGLDVAGDAFGLFPVGAVSGALVDDEVGAGMVARRVSCSLRGTGASWSPHSSSVGALIATSGGIVRMPATAGSPDSGGGLEALGDELVEEAVGAGWPTRRSS